MGTEKEVILMGYSYEYSGSMMDDEIIMMVLGVYGVILAVIGLFSIAMYVIRSLSVYTIAKRRRIENPWLSWLPVGHEWILGSLSDQYKYITKKKVQNRRKVLLGLGIAGLLCGLLMLCLVITSVVVAVTDETAAAGMVLLVILLYLAVFILGIVTMVFGFMSKYDIYKSCDPKNAVAYLVISIFINVTEPFFLLVCRNKDLGMTPEEPEAPMPQTPAQEPAGAVPAEPEALPDAAVAELPAPEETVEEPAADPVIELPAAPAVTDAWEDEVPTEE